MRPKGLDAEVYAVAMVDPLSHHELRSPGDDRRVCVRLLYNSWAMCKEDKVCPFSHLFLFLYPSNPGSRVTAICAQSRSETLNYKDHFHTMEDRIELGNANCKLFLGQGWCDNNMVFGVLPLSAQKWQYFH